MKITPTVHFWQYSGPSTCSSSTLSLEPFFPSPSTNRHFGRGSIEGWTEGHVSRCSITWASPFGLVVFERRSCFIPRWDWTMNLLFKYPPLAGMTSVSLYPTTDHPKLSSKLSALARLELQSSLISVSWVASIVSLSHSTQYKIQFKGEEKNNRILKYIGMYTHKKFYIHFYF